MQSHTNVSRYKDEFEDRRKVNGLEIKEEEPRFRRGGRVEDSDTTIKRWLCAREPSRASSHGRSWHKKKEFVEEEDHRR